MTPTKRKPVTGQGNGFSETVGTDKISKANIAYPATRGKSLRAAINAKCRECIYDPGDTGTWRQQTEACTSPGCPLYPVRPLSRKVIFDTEKGAKSDLGSTFLPDTVPDYPHNGDRPEKSLPDAVAENGE